MTKEEWKRKIVRNCRAVGTYQKPFEPVIITLAQILEQRDRAIEDYESTGAQVLIEHTNKSGATNVEQNPTLRLINDLNRDALAYWRDLGLTPAGLKRLTDTVVAEKKKSALEEALEKIGST